MNGEIPSPKSAVKVRDWTAEITDLHYCDRADDFIFASAGVAIVGLWGSGVCELNRVLLKTDSVGGTSHQLVDVTRQRPQHATSKESGSYWQCGIGGLREAMSNARAVRKKKKNIEEPSHM